ncbi:hypothetical protein [Methanoculleus sp.]|uniref:hypothetical protein n=1 Tax=Methanoculleus sp. TaxID=90427 RepID=UPI0025DBA804|nr:hypothetical protein [Methanoculleus sp.]MCK9320040.1 hypothetical protein [Methanoculleus sp.]
MKKLILILAAAMLLVGCKKEEEPEKDATYSFVNNLSQYYYVDTYIMECAENGDVIKSYNIDRAITGKVYSYTAQKMTVKVKIFLDMTYGTREYHKWINQVFYLTKGDNTNIELNPDTILSTDKP